MAPLLISYGQSIVDDYRKQMLVEEYLREHGNPTRSVTETPSVHAPTLVVLDTEVTNSSSDIFLDQSPLSTYIGRASPRDFLPSLPWFWSDSPSQHVATSKANANATTTCLVLDREPRQLSSSLAVRRLPKASTTFFSLRRLLSLIHI